MSVERWLPVPGYEGRYDVSDPRARPFLVAVPRRANPTDHDRQAGQGRLSPDHPPGRTDRSQRNWPVHRLVLLAFRGQPPPGMESRHANGNPADNQLSNLMWSTKSRNIRDQLRHGTHVNARKTHCKAGHLFNTDNTKIKNGGRYCITCSRLRTRAEYRRMRRLQKAVKRWRRMRRNGDLDFWPPPQPRGV